MRQSQQQLPADFDALDAALRCLDGWSFGGLFFDERGTC